MMTFFREANEVLPQTFAEVVSVVVRRYAPVSEALF